MPQRRRDRPRRRVRRQDLALNVERNDRLRETGQDRFEGREQLGRRAAIDRRRIGGRVSGALPAQQDRRRDEGKRGNRRHGR